MKKRKVFYIHEGVFGSYKKDSSTRTAADHIAAGKELAKKAKPSISWSKMNCQRFCRKLCQLL